MIVGITGLIGSGKDTIANYIAKKYNFFSLTMGDIVRKIVSELNLPENRDSQIYVGRNYRDEIISRTLNEVKKHKNVVVVGIRTFIDYKSLKDEFGDDFHLILLEADQKKRFERLKRRASTRDANRLSEFLEQERNEYEAFDFDKIFPKADFIVKNNDDLSKSLMKIDKIMGKLGITS